MASFTGGEVTVDDVEGLLGEVDATQLFEVATLIARRDIAGCFRWIAATAETGTDLAELVREFTGHVRDLFLIAAVGDGDGLVDRTAEELALLPRMVANADLYILNWDLMAYYEDPTADVAEYLGYLSHQVRFMEYIEGHLDELAHIAEEA